MAAKKIVERMKFRWRAKGRHGTHSPFVYAFVEQVLRTREKVFNKPSDMTPKEWRLLYATIRYMGCRQLILSDTCSADLEKALLKNCSDINVKIVSKFELEKVNQKVMYILNPNDITTAVIKMLESVSSEELAIYCLNPKHISSNINFIYLKNLPEFKMVLDFWDAQLLVKSNDFKIKQFFELK